MDKLQRSPTLVEAAAESIRQAICSGQFQPGQPLREKELSKSLNISRGTVREALRLLRNEHGLVEVFPYRGTFVTRLSSDKVREIYTLRALLESYAVRIATENKAYTDEDMAVLKKMVVRLRDLKESKNYVQDVETDMKFHRLLSQRCNHNLLLDVLDNLQSQILVFILNTKLYESEPEPQDISHQAILNGIISNDPAQAEASVRKHITDAGASLLQQMSIRSDS